MSAGPHKYPKHTPPDADILAWKCSACGTWVSEQSPPKFGCPVDWRDPNWAPPMIFK